MHKTILVATDFSEGASAALQHAEILARATGSEIDVIHVDPETVASPSEESRIRDLLSQSSPEDTSIKCNHILRHGDPADEIIKYANSKQVEMIVMGTHGQTNSPEVHAGKITQQVLEQADFLVITVKRPLSLMVTN